MSAPLLSRGTRPEGVKLPGTYHVHLRDVVDAGHLNGKRHVHRGAYGEGPRPQGVGLRSGPSPPSPTARPGQALMPQKPGRQDQGAARGLVRRPEVTFPPISLGATATGLSYPSGTSPEPSGAHIHSWAARSAVALVTTLTSNARPEVAGIAIHQAVQVGEPGYLQVGAYIVPDVTHGSGSTKSSGYQQDAGESTWGPS